jgi:signal transduction histidine kinase
MIKRDPSRFLQLGFLALLFLCVLQAAWWISDNVRLTRDIETVQAVARASAAAAAERGPGVAEADLAYTSLATIEADLAKLSEGRVKQYLWEGAFFLVVLIGGMAVLTRTLRHDAELRRRQQNFLAAVSHEFKSPLASMQLAAETLVLRSGDPDSVRLGQRILEDCERLLRMVDNLLDTTRIEEGRHYLHAEHTLLAPQVAAIVESFSERAARHGIRISQRVPGDVSLSIDRAALDTMLRNLIDNALKACIAGHGHHIEVGTGRVDRRIRLTVQDDGLGFPPEESHLMFEKFHRLGDELTRKTPGTGLGLYIVRRLADLTGAEVTAASVGPGHGATLTLSWPEESPR